jgi:hypothetical protein
VFTPDTLSVHEQRKTTMTYDNLANSIPNCDTKFPLFRINGSFMPQGAKSNIYYLPEQPTAETDYVYTILGKQRPLDEEYHSWAVQAGVVSYDEATNRFTVHAVGPEGFAKISCIGNPQPIPRVLTMAKTDPQVRMPIALYLQLQRIAQHGGKSMAQIMREIAVINVDRIYEIMNQKESTKHD